MDGKAAARFWAKVDHSKDDSEGQGDRNADGACWHWLGAKHRKGYGLVKLDGRLHIAHRVAWRLARGVKPVGTLTRTCTTVGCVRPDHYAERTPPPAARRPERLPRGMGHVRQRSPGAFTVEIVTGRDPLDPRRKLRATFTVRGTIDDVRRAVEEFHTHAGIGARVNLAAKGTFGELLDLWLDHARLADSTRAGYRGYIDTHIKPGLGHIPVRELTTFHFDRFYAELARRGGRCRHCWWRARTGLPPLQAGETYQPGRRTPDPEQVNSSARPSRRGPKATPKLRVHEPDCAGGLPLAPATERHVHKIIHRALEQARKWNLITINPAGNSSRSPVPLPDIAPPAAHDVARLLTTAFAEDRRFGLFLWMSVIIQGRRGETAGLRWNAIDFASHELRVVGTLERNRTWKPYPKNRKGRRVRLDPLSLALLADEWERQWEYAATCGTTLRADGWVFAHALSPDGARAARPDGFSSRFQQLCGRLGVTVERGLYGLRHFGATDLVRAGVDIRTVAGRLGNDPTMALRRYIHFRSDADADAVQGLADRLSALLEPISGDDDQSTTTETRRTCPQGHPWTEENTFRNPATGAHVCRECEQARHRHPLRLVADRNPD